jgi:hypothetical protein
MGRDQDIELLTSIMALQIFAEETERMIDELDLYEKSGILGKDIYDGMEKEITTRLAISTAKLGEILQAVDTGLKYPDFRTYND